MTNNRISLNSKYQARNSKQYRNSKFQYFKQILDLGFWALGFARPPKFSWKIWVGKDFGFLPCRQAGRISDFRRRRGGYIALIALLIVAAAGLTISIAVSLSGIEEIQISYSNSVATKAKSLANSCLEEGLERLRNNWTNYSGALSIAGGSCIINTEITDNVATLTAFGTVDIYTQKIQIQVNNDLEVINWQSY